MRKLPKVIFIVMSFLILSYGTSLAQNSPIVLKKDTSCVRELYRIAKDSLRHGNADRAIDIARSGLNLASNINDQLGMATHLLMLGNGFDAIPDHDSALFYTEKALELFLPLDHKRFIGQAYHNLGTILYEQGNYSESLTNYLKALTVRESIKDSMGMGWTHNNMGNIYWYKKAYNDALFHYKISDEIFKKIHFLAGQANTCNNIAMIFEKQEQLQDARKYYEMAIDIHMKSENFDGAAMCINNLGAFYQGRMGDVKEAERCYRRSMELNEKMGNGAGLGLNLMNLGTIRSDHGDVKGAEEWFKKALELYIRIGAKQGILDMYEKYAEMYSANKMYKQAYEYQIKYKNAYDSLFSGDKLAEMEALYGKEKHEKEISLLKKEKEVQELEIKRKQLIIYAGVGGGILLIGFIIFIVRGYVQKRRANQLLEDKNDQITQQKQIIEEKQKEIIDSIHYAKRIQKALIANELFIAKTLDRLQK